MKRRDFLKKTVAATAANAANAVTGGLLAGLPKAIAQTSGGPTVPGPQPNILFILVDELRFPSVFPDNIQTPDQFISTYMPNLYKLWQSGVKFGNHNTGANACTPSRGVLITGLYSQQQWLLTTILSTPYPSPPTVPQPVLNPAYPTYGRLLQAAGYQTPYIGKWHVSVPSPPTNTLENYGFDYYPTYYDPTGTNLQGTYGDERRGYHDDAYTTSQAIDWLTTMRPASQPWCLTVGLINPHDREFFPAGTEFKTFTKLFKSSKTNPGDLNQVAHYPGNGPVVPWGKNALKSPNSYGFPELPPNWECTDTIKANKPSTQTYMKEFSQAVWGGISDDSSQGTATVEAYPGLNPLSLGVAKAPYSYWQRGLDSYTQTMQIVDVQIGRLLDTLQGLPQSVVENTVIVFASDHGEYNGAHGFVSGKIGSVYEEAWHVPLIVVDPSGRFTGDEAILRSGLTSHVDLMPLLVTIGNLGSRSWMTGNLATIYGGRHDMIPMLKSASAPGRPYVLYATDEIAGNIYNFNNSPTNILGLRTEETKLGVYAKWVPLTSNIIRSSIELEFYDYSTMRGMLELDNTAATDPRAKAMEANLLNNLLPNELQQGLPGALGVVQQASKVAHLAFREFIAIQPTIAWAEGALQSLLGYGLEF
jgi:arylsulfatase A-like enzyme